MGPWSSCGARQFDLSRNDDSAIYISGVNPANRMQSLLESQDAWDDSTLSLAAKKGPFLRNFRAKISKNDICHKRFMTVSTGWFCAGSCMIESDKWNH